MLPIYPLALFRPWYPRDGTTINEKEAEASEKLDLAVLDGEAELAR